MKKTKVKPLPGKNIFKRIMTKLLARNFLLFITIVLFVGMYIVGLVIFKEKNFGNTQVFFNLFISNAGLIITTVGMTMVLIIGGIDISVGSVVAVTCMMLASMMEKGNIDAIPAMIIVLIYGVAFGSLFGVLIKANIETFVSFQGNLSSWWSKIIIAALLAFFIVLQSVLAKRKEKNT